MRLMVIGPPGSGKTTLCRRLAKERGLPLHHVDTLFFEEDWKDRPTEEFIRDHEKILAEEEWILDGNATGHFAPRITRATHLIYLHTPRLLCIWRVISRSWRYRNRPRADRPAGCPEQLNFHLFRYLWRYHARYADNIRALAAANPQLVYIEHHWPQRLDLAD